MSIEEKIENKIKELTDEMLEDENQTLENFYQKGYARQVLQDLLK